MSNLDYFKEALNIQESIVNEQAMPLKDAKEKSSALGKQLAIHFALIGMLGPKDENYEHWVSESANFCKLIDNIKIKGSRKLDADFFIDEFMYHLDTDNDAEIEANSAWVLHGMPDITKYDFKREDFSRFKKFRNDCFEELADLFADKKDHTQDFYKQFIDDKVSKWLKGTK